MKSNMARTVASKVMSFAHLAGIGARAETETPDDKEEKDEKSAKGAKAEGDDERKKRDDETDDEYSARMAAMDDDESAEGDDPEKKDDEDEDKPKSKAKAEDEDDKDDEMRGKSTAAQARLREQARCAAIFSHKAAAAHPVVAANLAFTTRMPRSEALAVLDGMPAKATAPGHAGRAARNPSGIAGSSAPSLTGAAATAARWDANLSAASGRHK